MLLNENLGWKLIYCLFNKFDVKIDIELVLGKLLYLFDIDNFIMGVKLFWLREIEVILFIVMLFIFIVE